MCALLAKILVYKESRRFDNKYEFAHFTQINNNSKVTTK